MLPNQLEAVHDASTCVTCIKHPHDDEKCFGCILMEQVTAFQQAATEQFANVSRQFDSEKKALAKTLADLKEKSEKKEADLTTKLAVKQKFSEKQVELIKKTVASKQVVEQQLKAARSEFEVKLQALQSASPKEAELESTVQLLRKELAAAEEKHKAETADLEAKHALAREQAEKKSEQQVEFLRSKSNAISEKLAETRRDSKAELEEVQKKLTVTNERNGLLRASVRAFLKLNSSTQTHLQDITKLMEEY